MKLALSAKHIVLALGIAVTGASGCDPGGMTTPDQGGGTYTWTQVSTDMKTSCALSGCHLSTNAAAAQNFKYDTTMAPGSDMANLTALMAISPAVIDKTTPANSVLIVVAKGGMFNGMTHTASLTTAKATSWAAWITAGALFQ